MSTEVQLVDTGYEPRPFQQMLHRKLMRFNVLVCHRRFGKTVFSINEMIDRALANEKKNPQYAYIAPTYGQAKRVAWEYIKDYTKGIPGVRVHEGELRIDIYRSNSEDKIRFMLLGAENPGSLRGIYLDGCILDEYAECDPTVWTQVIRPALSDRLGWAIFIGTPKGQNHFYDIYMAARIEETWFTAIFKASETDVVAASELKAARITMSEEEYEQEFECSFSAALVGAYYGKYIERLEKENRITNVPYDPAVPVHTFWDLGIGDATAIWFAQQVGQEIHLIDYLENSGVGLEWYANALKKKPYVYGDHGLPHDAAAKDLSTGKTRMQTLSTLGIRGFIIPRQAVEDGIHAARMLLPKCWFDITNCAKGVNALRNYQKKWDPKNKIYSSKPLHDWSSHAADAFRYLALGLKEDYQRLDKMKLPREANMDFDLFQL
jgi:hypothetical protein